LKLQEAILKYLINGKKIKSIELNEEIAIEGNIDLVVYDLKSFEATMISIDEFQVDDWEMSDGTA